VWEMAALLLRTGFLVGGIMRLQMSLPLCSIYSYTLAVGVCSHCSLSRSSQLSFPILLLVVEMRVFEGKLHS